MEVAGVLWIQGLPTESIAEMRLPLTTSLPCRPVGTSWGLGPYPEAPVLMLLDLYSHGSGEGSSVPWAAACLS